MRLSFIRSGDPAAICLATALILGTAAEVCERPAKDLQKRGIEAEYHLVPNGEHLNAYLPYAPQVFDILDKKIRRMKRAAICHRFATLILRHEWMDVKRIVYLNHREHPQRGPRTSPGSSIGHFDGDTLAIPLRVQVVPIVRDAGVRR